MKVDMFDDEGLSPSSRQSTASDRSKKRRYSTISMSSAGQSNAGKQNQKSTALKEKSQLLACLNCRPKKIKCLREGDSCRRCKKLNIKCIVPEGDERRTRYSRKYIVDLQDKIAHLEKALADSEQKQNLRSKAPPSPPASQIEDNNVFKIPEHKDVPQPPGPKSPGNLITRLCERGASLSSNDIGELRFFGPTSSLHLTESVSSSIFHGCDTSSIGDASIEEDLPLELQEYLLDIYWTYQHTVLQIIHKQAFLQGMRAGTSRYFSRCLLYSIFVCAARISNRPEISELAIPKEDDDEQPFLLREAKRLLDKELGNPGITTIQSLMLLSLLDCCRSEDSLGWIRSGMCLHIQRDEMQANLSLRDCLPPTV